MNKKNGGFTLIEVMAGLAIISFVLTALIGLVGALRHTTTKATRGLDRIEDMVNFMYEAPEKHQGKKMTRECADNWGNQCTLSYEKNPLAKKSSLADLSNLMIERVEARWHVNNQDISDVLIKYVYSPSQDKRD